MEGKIEVSVASRGVRIDAGVNGAPLVRSQKPTMQHTTLPVDWWILPDDNLLTATVSGDGEADEPMLDFAIRLAGDRSKVLCRLQWQVPAGTSFEPFTIALPFNVAGASISPTWEHCETIGELDAETLSAIQRTGASLHRAFERRDAALIVSLLERRIGDFCAAFGDNVAEHRRAIGEEFLGLFSRPDVVLEPVRAPDIRVAPCAGERVFHLTREDGGELIDIRGDALTMTMQVYVARVDGSWIVLR